MRGGGGDVTSGPSGRPSRTTSASSARSGSPAIRATSPEYWQPTYVQPQQFQVPVLPQQHFQVPQPFQVPQQPIQAPAQIVSYPIYPQQSLVATAATMSGLIPMKQPAAKKQPSATAVTSYEPQPGTSTENAALNISQMSNISRASTSSSFGLSALSTSQMESLQLTQSQLDAINAFDAFNATSTPQHTAFTPRRDEGDPAKEDQAKEDQAKEDKAKEDQAKEDESKG